MYETILMSNTLNICFFLSHMPFNQTSNLIFLTTTGLNKNNKFSIYLKKKKKLLFLIIFNNFNYALS